jgi:mono/diheme cytochrome c family protein
MTMIAIQVRNLCFVLMLALVATPINGFYQVDDPVTAAPSSTTDIYVEKIRPLLDQHCTQCHGSEEQGGGLKLDSIASMMVGGDSGAAVKPSDASASLLWQRVSSTNPDERMPPEGAALSTSELDLLKSWIQSGASGKDDPTPTHNGWEDRLDHWAWKPMQKHAAPLLPQVAGKVLSPVDSWIAAKLIEHDLTFSPAAEKRIWLRRDLLRPDWFATLARRCRRIFGR